MIPQSNHQYSTRSLEDVTTFYCRTDVLKYSYSPYTNLEWNKLDMQVRRLQSFLSFKNSLIKIGPPTTKPTYNIHNPIGVKFLTRLRLGLSHLNRHKFTHHLQDCVQLTTLCAHVVWRLNPLPISFSTAIISWTNMQPSLMSCSQLI